MKRINAQLEQQISEHLDGRLDADAEAALYRELLRDPQARERMDQYAANDRDASLALREVIMGPTPLLQIEQWPRRRWQVPWAQIMATAALVLVAVSVWMVIEHLPEPAASTASPSVAAQTESATSPVTNAPAAPTETAERERPSADAVFAAIPEVSGEPWWRSRPVAMNAGRPVDQEQPDRVVAGPQHIHRDRERSLIGVFDDRSDRVYWMQVDRQNTRIQAVGGEL